MRTIEQYLKDSPRTILAKNLFLTSYIGNTEIYIGSGIISLSPQSNLAKRLKQYSSTKYVVGGRAGKYLNDGHYFAIILPKRN